MKILVTGGAGLIGSNLVPHLIKRGDDVVVVDNLWRGKLENLFGGNDPIIDIESRFFQYDLRDYKKCLEVTSEIDVVVHLADIVAGISFVLSNELFLFRANNLINSNVLSAAIENDVNSYLYVGTACSYPAEKQATILSSPLKESDAYPANPESAYGWSKLMGEYECGLAHKEGKINVAILRLHNVYGSPCELSMERSQVIPALCRKAILHPDEEFVVWGSGSQRRGFLHVDDAVHGIIAALESGMGKGVIQIGPEHSYSIGDIAERIVQLSGKNIPIRFDTEKPEGDKDRFASLEKAERLLGWKPTVSLDTGLAKTYSWAKTNLINR
jgi:GDP-D-mannose 3',5'-epimerase